MNLKLEIEFSKADIIQKVDALKKQIDDMRPLPEDVEGRVMQKLRLDWNYNSNAIEGNKLSYGETAAFLSEGITAKGKPLKDHLDIRGHNEAINFLLEIVKDSRPISETDIRALHKMILVESYEVKAQTSSGVPTTKRISLGEYKTSANHVKTSTGELHYYASPEETPAKMQELMDWYTTASADKEIHPIVVAALFHHKFVAIHPFDDGNGRLSRILMNLILMQNGFPPVVIKMDDRQNYYSLLRRADVGESWPFVDYLVERLQNSLHVYLKAAIGEDINEIEDIDKEIALFKIDLHAKVLPKRKASKDDIDKVVSEVIFPFLEILADKLKVFEEFFNQVIITSDEPLVFQFGDPGQKIRIDPHKEYDLKQMIEYNMFFEKKIKSIPLFVNLLGFKNPDNIFDVVVDLHIEFNDDDYLVSDGNKNLNIYKRYHEKLSKSEQNLIIKKVLNDAKYLIDDKFKN